jgi:hypothetical protein
MSGNEYSWVWKGGSFWSDAKYAVVAASGQLVARVTLPGYRGLIRGMTRRHRIGRALIATKEGRFFVQHHSTTERDIRLISVTEGLVAQVFRKTTHQWMEFRDTAYDIDIWGNGSYETSKAGMILRDPDGRTALTLTWSDDRVRLLDMPATNSRRFHRGRASVGDGDTDADIELFTAFAFCVFMRPFLSGGGG